MRIAYFTNQYPKVSHTFVRREIAGLESAGHTVRRFAIRAGGDELVDPKDLAELELTEVLLQRGTFPLVWNLLRAAITRPVGLVRAGALACQVAWRSERGLGRHLAYLAEATLLRRWLDRDQIAHVHAHFGTNSTTVVMLCRALGGPTYSFAVHGPEEFDKPRAIRLDEKIRRSAFVAAITSYGRSQLYRWCPPAQWPKVQVVPMGVDESYLDGPPPPRVTDTAKFVSVGRLAPQKGHVLLVEAIAKVVSQGRDVEVVILGDGEMRGAIESRIKELGLEAQVAIAGWASGEEVRAQILDARALLMPSFAEGLPVVIMEALALGRPVLSTYVAGIPELVETGKCGWLFPAGCVDSIAAAVNSALDAPVAQLAEMGAEGRRRVLAHHDCRQISRHLAELIESVVKE